MPDQPKRQITVHDIVDIILKSAIATWDNAWIKAYISQSAATSKWDGDTLMQLDIAFQGYVQNLRSVGIITADRETVLAEAQKILINNTTENCYGAAEQYGAGIIKKPEG